MDLYLLGRQLKMTTKWSLMKKYHGATMVYHDKQWYTMLHITCTMVHCIHTIVHPCTTMVPLSYTMGCYGVPWYNLVQLWYIHGTNNIPGHVIPYQNILYAFSKSPRNMACRKSPGKACFHVWYRACSSLHSFAAGKLTVACPIIPLPPWIYFMSENSIWCSAKPKLMLHLINFIARKIISSVKRCGAPPILDVMCVHIEILINHFWTLTPRH